MACSNKCDNCTCGKDDYIYDESGFVIGTAGYLNTETKKEDDRPGIPYVYDGFTDYVPSFSLSEEFKNIQYKYAEDQIISDFKDYIDKTYGEHYMTEDQSLECFDAWIALGDSTPTFRNTALKYLWRYGKKNGNSKKDLLKTLHYVLMCLYVDHYKDKK